MRTHELYEDVTSFGEHPENVPGSISVPTEIMMDDEEKLQRELEAGEAGKVSRILQNKGKFVSAVRKSPRAVGLYVAEHPWQIASFAAGAAVVAGTILFQRVTKEDKQKAP